MICSLFGQRDSGQVACPCFSEVYRGATSAYSVNNLPLLTGKNLPFLSIWMNLSLHRSEEELKTLG